MRAHDLTPGRYLSPTPGGAYTAVQAPTDDPARRTLLALMAGPSSPLLTPESALAWTGASGPDEALDVVYRLQSLALIQADEVARQAVPDALERLLPGLLERLSSTGRALLADAQGFYIASAGFPHETAERLSALSADLASMHRRHASLLGANLGLPGSNWALVDAAGNSRIGAWTLHAGDERFALVVAGVPRFNQPALVELVWALVRRYAHAGRTPGSAAATSSTTAPATRSAPAAAQAR